MDLIVVEFPPVSGLQAARPSLQIVISWGQSFDQLHSSMYGG